MTGEPGIATISAVSASARSFRRTSFLSMKVRPSEVMESRMGSPPCFSSDTSFARGSCTGLPRWSSGVITMKMMSSTRTTSTSGVTLMSLLTPLLPMSIDTIRSPSPRGLLAAHGGLGLTFLEEVVDELVGGVVDVDLHVLDAVRQIVEHHDGRDRHEEAEGGRDERFRDAGRHGAETARAGSRHRLEGRDDAGDGSEQPDEGRRRSDGGEGAQAATE